VLDVETLRFVLAVVSLAVLALFFLGVYRPTHSPFSGWWTISLVCAATSAILLLGDGTSAQSITNPASSAIAAMGAVGVWFATRSLRQRRSSVWILLAAGAACALAGALDHPSSNEWAGNGLLFAIMSAGFTAGAYEVWATWAQRRREPDRRDSSEAITALLVCGIAGAALAALYVVRLALFVFSGPDHDWFARVGGSGPATLVLLICLVAVTFSVSAIGWDQRTRELRRRATEDDLTGLLGRTAFLARAQEAIDSSGGRRARQAWLVIADIDNFKPINDSRGHQAGDHTLVVFADMARRALRSSDAIGRLGGDEFGFVLENAERGAVLARLDEIRDALAHGDDGAGYPMPTVSFGVAQCRADHTLSETLGHADAALYDAKRAGRDRAEIFVDVPVSD